MSNDRLYVILGHSSQSIRLRYPVLSRRYSTGLGISDGMSLREIYFNIALF